MLLGSIPSPSRWVEVRTGAFNSMFTKKNLLAVGLTAALAFAASLSGQVSAIAQEESPKPQVLFTNVNVFDGKSDTLAEGMSVLVEGNLIKNVAKGDIDAGPNATVIDGGGRTLMPGLIDTHQHLMITHGGPTDYKSKIDPYMNAYQSSYEAERMLLKGFTTIRDVGGPSVSLGKAIDQGLVIGPRIYSSQGAITATSGHMDFRNYNEYHPNMQGAGVTDAWLAMLGWAFIADGPAEVRRATREALRFGATQIKVMAGGGVASLYDPLESVGYSEAEFRAAVEAATDYDTYVAIHAYNDESVRRAIRAGVLDCVHCHLVNEETVKMMAKAGMWLGSLSKPPGLLEISWFTDENRRKARTILTGYDNVMGWAKKHGLKIAFGTDAAGGKAMFDGQLLEFKAREKHFTPAEMLKQATSNSAELLAMSNSRNPYKAGPLGVIQKGAYADILLYDGNPLEDIGIVINPEKHLKVIMKDGKIYENTL
jgi:imidazolonepropionase-like amidohydrolase